jgi:hypothetical protein
MAVDALTLGLDRARHALIVSKPDLAPGTPAQVTLEAHLRTFLAAVDPQAADALVDWPGVLERAWHLISRAIAALGDEHGTL